MDDLDLMLEKAMTDLGFVKEYDKILEREVILKDRLCAFGNCVEWYDPFTNITDSSYGVTGCPCQR